MLQINLNYVFQDIKQLFNDLFFKKKFQMNSINKQQFIISSYKRRKMEFLSQKLNLEQLFNKFFKPIRKEYSSQALTYYLNIYPDITHCQFYLINREKQRLVCSLFLNSQSSYDACIIYLHGSGSNRFQSLQLLHFIPPQFSLFSFDFSGSGRSEGEYITFGEKEKYDLECAIKYLRSYGFKKFILWGRSMGANTAISYVSENNPSDVMLLILDSPFYSFQSVAMQMAHRKTGIPEVVLQIPLNSVKNHCQKFQYNPFSVQAKCISSNKIPTIFVYSENDTVISWYNSEKIIKYCRCKYQRIIIQENHNIPRTSDTIIRIFDTIKKYTKNTTLHENKFLQNRNKGINLVKACEKKFGGNGIWVSMKFNSQKSKFIEKNNIQQLKMTKTSKLKQQRIFSTRKHHVKNARSQQQTKFNSNRNQQRKIELSHQYYI